MSTNKLKDLLKRSPDTGLMQVIKRDGPEKQEIIAENDGEMSYQLSHNDLEVVIHGGEAIVKQGPSIRFYLFDKSGQLLKSMWTGSDGEVKEGCYLNMEDKMLIEGARKLFEEAKSDPKGFEPTGL